MILYRPTDGGVRDEPVHCRPRTAFLLTQLGGRLPEELVAARSTISTLLADRGFSTIDADSVTTGKDFLLKIWQLVLSVPLGVAVIQEGIPARTLANIFYELGWFQAYGKETIVVRVGDAGLPSDFVRTEYVSYNAHFERRFSSFLDTVIQQADHYRQLAGLLENNPLLAIDYFRRSYLISGDEECRALARGVFETAGFVGRARNSVESLLVTF